MKALLSLPFLFLLFGLSLANVFGFDCPSLPAHSPANISDLRPTDIKVVMALGDSITAGFGMQGQKGGLNESRGASFSIGGDGNATTVANFLKFYSPAIQGASVGTHVVEFCGGPVCPPFQYHPTVDVLNAAQSGAMVANLLPHETDYLLKMLAANPAINMKEDWKLLTILIGANDLCGACANNSFLHPDDYQTKMTTLLESVRTNIPRVFVQLVEMFNLSGVYELSLTSPYCADVHRVLGFECGCLFEHPTSATLALLDQYSQAYNQRAQAIAAHYQSLAYTDFAVVVQPFGRDTNIADYPISILSTLDCFHPSLYAHQSMAIALWNNMLTPAAQKKTSLDLSDTPICPTADTLLYTW